MDSDNIWGDVDLCPYDPDNGFGGDNMCARICVVAETHLAVMAKMMLTAIIFVPIKINVRTIALRVPIVMQFVVMSTHAPTTMKMTLIRTHFAKILILVCRTLPMMLR